MKRLVLLAALVATPVLAQTAPPPKPFAPITIDQTDYNAIGQFINSQPYGTIVDFANFWSNKEASAQAAAGAAQAKADAAALAAKSPVEAPPAK
jgi:hypothetical protein